MDQQARLMSAKPKIEHLPPELRVGLAVTVALALFLASHALNPSRAWASYSCGNGYGSGHCYGQYDWNGSANGSITSIFIVHLTCNSSCSNNSGWVDNDMWLLDGHNYPPYWVESGYESYPAGPSNNDSYFWADKRPNDGYNWHDFGQVPSGDYQHNTSVTIVKDGSQSWEVQLSTYTTGYSAFSTSNNMSPSDIIIGQELAGVGGANAPVSFLSNNQYIDSNYKAHYQGYGSDNTPYPLESDNPPYASWFIHPQDSSTGGSLQTSCC